MQQDIKIGDKVWVAVPAPADATLEGKQMLRKPGQVGRPGSRMETLDEMRDGLLYGRPADVPRHSWDGYHTGTPELVEVTPWILRNLGRGSLIMVDAPTADTVTPTE